MPFQGAVCAVMSPSSSAAVQVAHALFAMQYRGPVSAGLLATDGITSRRRSGPGLVSEVLRDLEDFTQPVSLGGVFRAVVDHPLQTVGGASVVACGRLDDPGQHVAAAITKRIEDIYQGDLTLAVQTALTQVGGAFAGIIATPTSLMAFRDPMGLQSLVLGRLGDGGWSVASEGCAFTVQLAKVVRDVAPGELVIIEGEEIKSYQFAVSRPAVCALQYVYLMRPDSSLAGRSVHVVRQATGAALATEAPVAAQAVMPFPDAAMEAAIGFHHQSGVPFNEGVVKNRYPGVPIEVRYNVIRENVAGKRVILVEDSVVTAETVAQAVKMLRSAGALQVHVRVASPPLRCPCPYGNGTGSDVPLAASSRSIDQLRQDIGADSLAFLSLPGLVESIGLPLDQLCLGCFNGQFPDELVTLR